MSTFFILLTLLFAILFLYPYAVYPLVLRFLPQYRASATADSTGAEVGASLLFCAYNEEDSLPKKIRNIRSLKEILPKLEVLAYSDCSSDATDRLLQDASDVLTPVLGTERLGKVLGMQKLVSMATGEILIFTDANVMVDVESLPVLLNYFGDPEIGAVAGTLLYDEEPAEDGTVAAEVGGLYWQLEEHIKQLETATGSMMGADGALFARRRQGYPELPPDTVDDMAVSMDVIFHGMRCISASDVIGHEGSVQSAAEEFKRKRRIACGSYTTYRFLQSSLNKMSAMDRFKFFSHKVLRWWGAFFLLGGAISFLLAGFFGGYFMPAFFLLLAGCGGIFAGARLGIGPVLTVYEILMAIFATGIGVVESLTGRAIRYLDTCRNKINMNDMSTPPPVKPMNLVMFSHNRKDTAFVRRVMSLRPLCEAITTFSFRRDGEPAEPGPDWDNVDLGYAEHAQFGKRILLYLNALWTVIKHRQRLCEADVIHARNLERFSICLGDGFSIQRLQWSAAAHGIRMS